MSSARSNAAARNRRAAEPPSEFQNGQGRPGIGRPGIGRQQPPAKMTISDAIALITLRLGRIESIVHDMPVDLPQNQNSVDEGARIVNDKVFENIVARIESIEKGQKILLENQKKIAAASPVTSSISDEKIIQLSESYDVLKVEINQIKDVLLNLQSFTMETNKKLSEIVFSDFDYDYDTNIILCDNNEILASNILEEENILVVEENKDTNLQLSETTI